MALERVKDLIGQITQAARVESVYGEARDMAGKTIIPVARVSYGGGGGGGIGTKQSEGEEGSGGGGGLGVAVQPLGCFVVTDKGERWVPVVDVTKIALAGCAVAIFMLLTIRKIATHRRA